MAVHASFANNKLYSTIFAILLTSLASSFLLASVFLQATHAAPAAAEANSRSILSSFSSLLAGGQAEHQQSRHKSLRVARAIADATKLTEEERNQFINELVMAELARRNAFLNGILDTQLLGQNALSSPGYSTSSGFGGGAKPPQSVYAETAGDFRRIARDDERGNVGGAGGANKWDVLSRAMPRFG